MGMGGKGESCGNYGKNADKFHNFLILSVMIILALYRFRYLLYCFRSELCTIVKVHSTTVGDLGALRRLRKLGELGVGGQGTR